MPSVPRVSQAIHLEIIEGRTQIHEWLLAREALAGAWEHPGDQPA